MTKVVFLADKGHINGFKISGHSSTDCEDQEGKIVCSAVSSAAYMAANTVTEIIGEECDISLDKAVFILKTAAEEKATVQVLEGLKLHLTELSYQYPERIKIISEV